MSESNVQKTSSFPTSGVNIPIPAPQVYVEDYSDDGLPAPAGDEGDATQGEGKDAVYEATPPLILHTLCPTRGSEELYVG
jgi:hypothetical protein